MVDTRIKPKLKQYGNRRVIYCKLSYLLIILLLITPGTNWIIPIVSAKVKGRMRFEI